MKILFTPSARDQFLKALAYIRRDKPSAAISFRQKAGGKLGTLPVFIDFHHVTQRGNNRAQVFFDTRPSTLR